MLYILFDPMFGHFSAVLPTPASTEFTWAIVGNLHSLTGQPTLKKALEISPKACFLRLQVVGSFKNPKLSTQNGNLLH